LFPRILRLLSSERLRIIGDGQNVTDLTYVDNVVDSLVRSLEAPATACGRAYNITNGEPIRLWDLITDIAIRLQVRPPQGHVSLPAARRLAGLMEVLWRFLPLKGEPPVTRYTVELLALNMTLDISAAQEQIGYAPRISMAEGLDRFFEWWQDQVPQ
jgi:nucleoside-diphosphate-sugar epimerase